MLSDTLNTNEVKNSAGVEVEFRRFSTGERQCEYQQIAESPAAPHRFSIKHMESGSGINRRRRSAIRFNKTVESDVDNATPVTISAYQVLDAPVGALTTNAEIANVLAELASFVSSLGVNSTILFDGTGNGATALINGSI